MSVNNEESFTRRAVLAGLGALALPAAFGIPNAAEAAPAGRSIRAMAVGIDKYSYEHNLRGAVNDAKDIADALKSLTPDVTALYDGQATRSAILDGLRRMLDESKSGDAVIFTYAGHGGHEPASGAVGATEEVLVLAGFTPAPPGVVERLRGAELVELFAAAEMRGVDVIFVADACFSGGLVRPFDTRSVMLPTRGPKDEIYELIGDPLPPIAAKSLDEPSETRAKMPHFIFLAAALQSEECPEAMIEGHPRGALSWAFARVLRGNATASTKQELHLGEMRSFVVENVRMQTGTRQTPDVLPADDPQRIILKTLASAAAAPGKAAITAATPAEAIKLFILGDAKQAPAGLDRVTLVKAVEDAEITWDLARQETIENGDLTAEGVGPRKIQDVVDKAVAIRLLRRMKPQKPLSMRLLPADKRFTLGEKITFTVDGREGQNLILFNLASDGEVEFQFPRGGENPRPPLDAPVEVTLKVTPPFGADHLVAIASQDDLADLADKLRELDGRRAGREAALLIAEGLKDRRWQLGIQPLFTSR